MPREKLDPNLTEAKYHLITRTVNKELLLDEEDRAMLQGLLWRVSEYCGVKLITHAEMGSHPHIDVLVPRKEPIDDKEILRRYAVLHNPPTRWAQGEITKYTKFYEENDCLPAKWRDRQLARMNDISALMQLFKQMGAVRYNRRHKRIGPLWNERFVSELIKGGAVADRAVAKYVDLNPLRAGLCKDPKDYPHCGYSEAVAGNEKAREGLARVVEGKDWEDTHSRYRTMLYEEGSRAREGKAKIPQEEVAKVLQACGQLTEEEITRVRNRYLTLGVAIGSYDFIQSRIDNFRQKTGRGSRMKPNPVPAYTGLGGLYTLCCPRNRDF